MKNLMILLMAALIGALVQCKSSRQALAAPGANELTIAQRRWPESTAQSLNEGYTTFTTRCTKCHGPKNIPSRSEEEWKSAIDRMAPKAKLTASEKTTLEHYVFSAREAAAGSK